MYFASPHLKIIYELYIPFFWNQFSPSLLPHRITHVSRTLHVRVSRFRDKILEDLWISQSSSVNTNCGNAPNCIADAVESSWNLMAHGEAREGKWRGNWRMEWVASTLHTTSELGVSNINTADVHTSATSSRLNCSPCRFKRTRPFRRKKKSGFYECAAGTVD